jgi:hypothetical protein
MTRATLATVATIFLAVFAITACALRVESAPAYEGHTFCASGATGYLLDPTGAVVHTWQASGIAQTCAYLLEDGGALFPIQNSQCNSPHHDGSYPNGRFHKVSWDGTITWDYRFCDATARAGYDVHPMPNGNILIPTDAYNVAKVFEVQPTGATSGDIVWQYALPDSLTGGNTYMNAVSYSPELDLIVADCSRRPVPIRPTWMIRRGLWICPWMNGGTSSRQSWIVGVTTIRHSSLRSFLLLRGGRSLIWTSSSIAERWIRTNSIPGTVPWRSRWTRSGSNTPSGRLWVVTPTCSHCASASA